MAEELSYMNHSNRRCSAKLVYFEETRDVYSAITREKEIKKWRREKKDQLVNRVNPAWRDLSEKT